MYTIFADGASKGNPGPSGSGVVVYKNNKVVRYFYGNYMSHSTNNIAELHALKFALTLAAKCIESGETCVTILTDSTYSIECVKTWIHGWLKSNWKNNTIKNQELIKEVFALYNEHKNKIDLGYVKGHAGIEGNELADRMANHAIATKQVEFERFEATQTITEVLNMYGKKTRYF